MKKKKSDRILIKLNKLITPMLKKIEKELNRNCVDFPEISPVNIYYIPTIVSLGNATIRNSKRYKLDSPVAGMVKDISYNRDPRKTVTIRRLIGYTAGLRIANHLQNISSLKLLLKEMILTLHREIGFTPDKINAGVYGKFVKFNGLYVTEIESRAAFEIRLYSQTVCCENIKGEK